MSEKIRIILADDHPIVRDGLRMIIETDANLEIVAEASDGAEAFSLIEEHKPDIALLDIDMPEKDGFTVVREMQKKNLKCQVIFLTMHDEDDIFLEAMDLGVKGYLLKETATRQIIKAIKDVIKGELHVTPSLASHLLNWRNRAKNLNENLSALEQLTPSERRILRMVAEYKTNKDIAEELFIHERAVANHRTNICQKLDISGYNGLLKYALENKKIL